MISNFKKVCWIIKTSLYYCFPFIAVYILCNLFVTVVDTIINVINKNIVNELVANTADKRISSIFIGLIVAYTIFYIVGRTGGFLRAFGSNFYRLNVGLIFRKIYMWKAYNTPQEKFFDTDFAEKFSFAGKAIPKIDGFIGIWVELIFNIAGSLVGMLIIFAAYEPWLIINVLLITAITALVYSYIVKKQYELDKRQIKEQRFLDYYRSILSTKENAKELRVYGTQEHFYQKWLEKYKKLRNENLELELEHNKLDNLLVIVRFLLRAATVALLTVGAFYERYDIGTFVMLFGMVDVCSGRVFSLVQVVTRGTFKEVKYLCDYYDFVAPVDKNEIRELLRQNKDNENSDTYKPYGDFEELQIENVSYSYPNSTNKAVDDVSLTIKRGEIVSILGYNGSGKTTLSKLMNGSLSPKTGSVKLNGVPISEANRREIFSYFGNAPQEFSRFSLKLKEIVGLGDINHMNNKEKLAEAYRKSDLYGLIQKYSTGDDIVIGKEYDEDGVDLSGGEWQRLIIASAYMGEPEILIMDEPTASIDPLREMELLQNFRRNLSGKTAILISHRIGFARLADRIVMMENGKITECGTHSELLAADGYYAKLFYEQKNLYDGNDNYVEKE